MNQSVLGRPQASDGLSGAIYSEGFVVIVHHPNDFAVSTAPTTYIGLNKETFIDIQPFYSSCTDQVLLLPFSQRKCIVPSDLGKVNYRQPECVLNCLRDIIYYQCKCHPFHLPKPSNQTVFIRDCTATDVLCFSDHYCTLIFAFNLNDFISSFIYVVEFKRSKCDLCFPSCTEINYKTSSFSMKFDIVEHSTNEL